MEIDRHRIAELIAHPSESLNVEIKRWLDPSAPEGIAKIVKAAFALRNRNGGFLLVGFDDAQLLPDVANRPADVHADFHMDTIQGLISKYASEAFEIGVGFGARDGVECPVVIIPEGVTVPVAAKRDLLDKGGNKLIREGDVYFRTLDSNGTPSTARARPGDWRDILQICFDNKEADIGRFLRRQLGGQNLDRFVSALSEIQGTRARAPPTLRDRANSLMEEGDNCREGTITARGLPTEDAATLAGLAWSVALVIDPPKADALPDRDFLRTVAGANPQYTGWPVWLDSSNFQETAAKPIVADGAWQALIVSLSGWSRHVDFMRLGPKGEFYLWRLLQDDMVPKQVDPGTTLDPILVILRVAEALAVGISFARALGWDDEATLGFAFRWNNINKRSLAPWANPLVYVSGGIAHDSSAETFIELSAGTPILALAPFVEQATRDLFVKFDGYTFPSNAFEEWIKRLFERKL